MRVAYVVDSLNWTEAKIFGLMTKHLPGNSFRLIAFGVADAPSAVKTKYDCGRDASRFVTAIKDFDPDIIHVNRDHPMSEILRLVSNFDAYKIETLQFDIFDEQSRIFDAHLPVSSFTALSLGRRFHLQKEYLERTLVVPNLVDVESILKASDRVARELRKEGDWLVGLAARPDSAKTYSPTMLDALKHLRRRVSNFRFLTIGGMPEAFRSSLPPDLKSHIIDIGPVLGPSVYDYMRALDVYTSFGVRGETFGVSIAEAMASAKPVVVNSTPWSVNAQTELVENNATGFVAQSTVGWAEAIASLIRRPEYASRMGGAGRERIIERHHPRLTAEKIAESYEWVQSPNRASSLAFDAATTIRLFRVNKANIYDRGWRHACPRLSTHVRSRLEIAGSSSLAFRGALKKLLGSKPSVS